MEEERRVDNDLNGENMPQLTRKDELSRLKGLEEIETVFNESGWLRD